MREKIAQAFLEEIQKISAKKLQTSGQRLSALSLPPAKFPDTGKKEVKFGNPIERV